MPTPFARRIPPNTGEILPRGDEIPPTATFNGKSGRQPRKSANSHCQRKCPPFGVCRYKLFSGEDLVTKAHLLEDLFDAAKSFRRLVKMLTDALSALSAVADGWVFRPSVPLALDCKQGLEPLDGLTHRMCSSPRIGARRE